MQIMILLAVALAFPAFLAISNIAYATTSYHFCERLQDRFELTPAGIDADETELHDGEIKLSLKSVSELTLSDRQGFCVSKSQRSYKWQLRKYLSTVNTNLDGQDMTLTFVCTNNSTGVPAGVEHCEDTITQDTRLEPTYVDKASTGKEAVLGKDLQTTYATTKAGCIADPWEQVTLASHRISGPQFDCLLTGTAPAGTGLMSVNAICSVDGAVTKSPITLDLGNFKDHFEMHIPGRKDWMALYPCTPVPGLK